MWAEAVRTELAAAGVDLAADRPTNKDTILTAQELQVALAVAAGATNREAANQLFLSPKTIEYHLSHVFKKLQVTSRAGVVAALAHVEG